MLIHKTCYQAVKVLLIQIIKALIILKKHVDIAEIFVDNDCSPSSSTTSMIEGNENNQNVVDVKDRNARDSIQEGNHGNLSSKEAHINFQYR